MSYNPKRITPLLGAYNRDVASHLFGVPVNPRTNGRSHIDLKDPLSHPSPVAMEVKSHLRPQHGKLSWAILTYNFTYAQDNPDHKVYCAFIEYGLNRHLASIPEENLARAIMWRGAWVTPWSYVDSLPIAEGKRFQYKYARESDFTTMDFSEVIVGGATLHLPTRLVPRVIRASLA